MELWGRYFRVSETQTHQIAALKERQMEKLKAALGIVSDKEKMFLDSELPDLGDNDEEDEVKHTEEKMVDSDLLKHRKTVEKGKQDAGDDFHGKKNNGRKNEIDTGSRKNTKRIRDGSSASETEDSDVELEKRRKGISRNQRKIKKHSSLSDDDSETDTPSKTKSHRRCYDTDDSDHSSGDRRTTKPKNHSSSKHKRRQYDDETVDEVHERKNKGRRYSDDDSEATYDRKQAQRNKKSGSDEGLNIKASRENETSNSKRRRSDSDDCDLLYGTKSSRHADDLVKRGRERCPGEKSEETEKAKKRGRDESRVEHESRRRESTKANREYYSESEDDRKDDRPKKQDYKDEKSRDTRNHGSHRRGGDDDVEDHRGRRSYEIDEDEKRYRGHRTGYKKNVKGDKIEEHGSKRSRQDDAAPCRRDVDDRRGRKEGGRELEKDVKGDRAGADREDKRSRHRY